jgi:rfaE bifunctional protein kinase chain/domain
VSGVDRGLPGHSPARAAALLDAMSGRRILVAGDYLLDRYVYGSPARLSREAPVLILDYEHEETMPGGAGNAARNVRALGGVPILLGAIGEDENGARLAAALEGAGVATSGLVRDPTRPTVAKTRILAGGAHASKQQVLRIDRGHRGTPGGEAAARLAAGARSLAAEADGVLLSDYGYGALSAAVRDALVSAAAERGIPSCADSRFDLGAFRGVTVATPNDEEAAALAGRPAHTDGETDAVGRAVLERLDSKALLLTRGSRGMALFLASGERLDVPVIGPEEVADVTGAGDTVAAAFLLALAAGGDPRDAARVANAAASVVVMRRGAAVATPGEVREAIAAWAREEEGRRGASR